MILTDIFGYRKELSLEELERFIKKNHPITTNLSYDRGTIVSETLAIYINITPFQQMAIDELVSSKKKIYYLYNLTDLIAIIGYK